MTCTNHCCGFVALSGMIGIGALTVSHGLGSCEFNPIIFPEDPYVGLQEGKGLETYIRAWAAGGPKGAVRFPVLDPAECDKPPTRADTFTGPKTMGMMATPEEEAPGTSGQALGASGPKVVGVVSSSSEQAFRPRGGSAVARGPRVAGTAPAAPTAAPRTRGQAVVRQPPKTVGEASEEPEETEEGVSKARTRRGPKIKG